MKKEGKGLKMGGEKGGGKPTKLSREEIEEVLLKEKFGVKYSEDQTVRILKKLGMRHSKPFSFDYRRPKDAEKILENELSLVFQTARGEENPEGKGGNRVS